MSKTKQYFRLTEFKIVLHSEHMLLYQKVHAKWHT